MDSPRISRRWALWTKRSRIPSAMVGSPICSCQRETGSPFATNAMIEADRVESIGEVTPVAVDTPSASGKGQKIWRCPNCQVAVWSNYGGSKDVVRFVRAGTLDQARTITPDIHIYTSTKLPWVALPEGAKSMPEFYDLDAVWSKEAKERRCIMREKLRAQA